MQISRQGLTHSQWSTYIYKQGLGLTSIQTEPVDLTWICQVMYMRAAAKYTAALSKIYSVMIVTVRCWLPKMLHQSTTEALSDAKLG